MRDSSLAGAARPGSDRFYVVSTIPGFVADAGRRRPYFWVSAPVEFDWLSGYLTRTLRGPPRGPHEPQWITGAVAVAASNVAATNRRRAVVLVLAEGDARAGAVDPSRDTGAYDIAGVRTYLAALQVPLVVWSLSPPGPDEARWGTVVHLRDGWAMQKEAKKLQKALASQRIVWLAGRHLPQRITLAAGSTGIELVR